MNLEQIDTSTTAGKAEVMRLAAEGRRVTFRPKDEFDYWEVNDEPVWDWTRGDYAIIAEPVGPEFIWADFTSNETRAHYMDNDADARSWSSKFNVELVRYIRADLAGEKC